jgi:hypothetical protein
MIKPKKTREDGNTMGMLEKINANKILVGRKPLETHGRRSRIILKLV